MTNFWRLVSLQKLEWNDLCDVFNDRSTTTRGRHRRVDAIHIFALSNVLRRPIVVLDGTGGATVSPGGGSSAVSTSPAGIYLPLLLDSGAGAEPCVRHPVVLAHFGGDGDGGRFLALVARQAEPTADRSTAAAASQPQSVVPLMTGDQEPVPMRCLLADVDGRPERVLETYLRTTEVSSTGPIQVSMILSARINYERVDEPFDVMRDVERWLRNAQIAGGAESRSAFDARRTAGQDPLRRSVSSGDSAGVQSRNNLGKSSSDDEENRPCANLSRGCQYYGQIEFNWFCSGCFKESTIITAGAGISDTPPPVNTVGQSNLIQSNYGRGKLVRGNGLLVDCRHCSSFKCCVC